MQTVAPDVGEYVPALQRLQPPCDEYWPAGQLVPALMLYTHVVRSGVGQGMVKQFQVKGCPLALNPGRYGQST